MKTYPITSQLTISGPNLHDAIEDHFSAIARHLHIGNAAGYQLHQVWMEYDPAAQAVALHVISTGSDCLVDYDPAQDPPRDSVLHIPAPPEDCPERVDFELSEKDPFDPFSDKWLEIPAAVYGILLALLDEISLHHCKLAPPQPGGVTDLVSSHYPGMRFHFPLRFVEACRKELARQRPKSDPATADLMVRVSDLAARLAENPKADLTADFLFESKTRVYFKTHNKVTALAAIRKKNGMTQAQLAEAAQISVRQLQNYEKCPGSTLSSAARGVPDRLAKALDVPRSAIVQSGFPILVDPEK